MIMWDQTDLFIWQMWKEIQYLFCLYFVSGSSCLVFSGQQRTVPGSCIVTPGSCLCNRPWY